MASRKIYFDETEGGSPSTLHVYFNNKNRLYLSIEDESDYYGYNFLTLSLDDAEEIALFLTEEVNLIKSQTEK